MRIVCIVVTIGTVALALPAANNAHAAARASALNNIRQDAQTARALGQSIAKTREGDKRAEQMAEHLAETGERIEANWKVLQDLHAAQQQQQHGGGGAQ